MLEPTPDDPDDPDDPDEVRESLKAIQLMDCDPGISDQGMPIVILRLACGGQIEQPLMLSRWDAKRLLVMLLVALHTHGDQPSGEILERHFGNDVGPPKWTEEGDPAVGAWPSPTGAPASTRKSPDADRRSHSTPIEPEPRQRIARSPSKIKFAVQHGPQYRPRHVAWVHGGFRREGVLVLLVRMRWGSGVVDELLRVVEHGFHVRERHMPAELRIAPEEWERFLSLPDGGAFRLGGREARKVPLADLRWLNGKTFKPA